MAWDRLCVPSPYDSPQMLQLANPAEILNDLPDEFDPRKLRAEIGATAEERGWILEPQAAQDIARQNASARIGGAQRRYAIFAMANRGETVVDIAAKTGLSVAEVHAVISNREKSVTQRATATGERQKQILETEALLHRLAERIWPAPDQNGKVAPVDTRVVETFLKVQTRRAALTGADMPAKVAIEGEITHKPAQELVDVVNEYMDLADELLKAGYGSGRAPEGGHIIDAEILDARQLPPPEPPVEPWKKKVDHEEDLVSQSTDSGDGDDGAVIIELDSVARAMRLPDPDLQAPGRMPSWSVPAHE